MTEHVAELMLYAISALGALVWLAGLRFLIASAQAGRLVSRQTAEQLEMEEPPTDDMIVGSAEVTGQPADLVSRAASLLAGGTASSLGLLKIVDRASDRLTFERAGEYAGGHAGRSLILKGQFRFAALGSNRTRIIYAVQLAPRRALLIGGVLFQFLGLAVLGVGRHPVTGKMWKPIDITPYRHEFGSLLDADYAASAHPTAVEEHAQ